VPGCEHSRMLTRGAGCGQMSSTTKGQWRESTPSSSQTAAIREFVDLILTKVRVCIPSDAHAGQHAIGPSQTLYVEGAHKFESDGLRDTKGTRSNIPNLLR